MLAKAHDVVPAIVAREALAMYASDEKFDLILCARLRPEMTRRGLARRAGGGGGGAWGARGGGGVNGGGGTGGGEEGDLVGRFVADGRDGEQCRA